MQIDVAETKTQIREVLTSQRTFFNSGRTKDLKYRKEQLKKLKSVIQQNESRIYEALYKDLRKSEIEAYSTELSFIYSEIDFFLKNLNQLAAPERVTTNIINQMGSSKIYSEPYGNALVMGAWNYPVQLSVTPCVSAIAAGNTVILKPSEIAAHSAEVMAEIINKNFEAGFFHVMLGAIPETTEILKEKFNKIFFTGSPQVGKIIYKAAAEHLTPVTLELGGKSPVIVTESANLKVAARRIVWGKYLNAGQTCLAPDYIYVHENVKDKLLAELKDHIQKSEYKPGSEGYGKIINEKHFDRLLKLIDVDKIYFGGHADKEKLHIEPTIVEDITWEDAVMQEEIFGPILPVLSFRNLDETLEVINSNEKPLAAYLFSGKSEEKEKFTSQISFGGGCINDTVMHISNPHLPFGGVGNSGMGSYHGTYGFDAFSHKKSVLEKKTWGEPNLKYPPFTDSKKKLLKWLM